MCCRDKFSQSIYQLSFGENPLSTVGFCKVSTLFTRIKPGPVIAQYTHIYLLSLP